MATKTITQFTDDLDGSTEDVETVKFGLFGATYEIDLSKGNQRKLEQALEPFLEKSRKASGGSPTARRSSGRTSGSSGSSGGGDVDAKAVRAWAASNDVQVPARGRIPGSVIEQYRAASH